MKTEYKCLETKRINRWILELPEDFKISSFMVKSIEKPKNFDDIWSDIEIRFFDSEACSTTHALYDLIKNGNFPCVFKLNMLNSIGEIIEMWEIDIDDLVGIDFGELDYDIDGPIITSAIFRVNDCKVIQKEE